MVYGSNYGTTNLVADVEPEVYDESMEIMDIGMQIMEESATEWNNMMKAIASVELGYVVENQQEMIYEAVDIRAWGEKVINWFKNILKKILGMLQTAKAKFMSWATKDATFLNKYEARIKEGAGKLPSGFSFKGYEFDDLAGKVKNIGSAMDEAIKGYTTVADIKNTLGAVKQYHTQGTQGNGFVMQRDGEATGYTTVDSKATKQKYEDPEKIAEYSDSIRGKLTGDSAGTTSSEFRKELFKLFHGSSSKVTINSGSSVVNGDYVVDTIKNAKTAIKAVEDQKKTTTKSINDAIKVVNNEIKSAKEVDASGHVVSQLNAGVTILKKASTDVATYCTMLTTALKDENRQAKALAVKFVSYAGYKGKLNESYSTQSYGSIFDEAFANI